MLRVSSLQIGSDCNSQQCGDINLILGSNNTGKTSFLNDIQQSLGTFEIRPESKWLKSCSIQVGKTASIFDEVFPGLEAFHIFDDAQKEFNKRGLGSVYGGISFQPQIISNRSKNGDSEFCFLIRKAMNRTEDYYYFNFFINLMMQSERCEQRLSGPFDTTINNITDPISNIVHFLYRRDEIFNEISKELKSVFDEKIVFDDLPQGRRVLRTNPVSRPTAEEKSNLEKYSVYWSKNSVEFSSLGDGIKAYLRILYSLYLPGKSVLLIDEPEAFLHPPQRRSLGRFIANHASENMQVFVSTHDSEILRGILSGKERDVKIFHLRNRDGARSCKVVDGADLRGSSRSMSEPMLNSFFHRTTVICEAEDDRAVYQYATEKYSKSDSIDLNFVGFNGKAESIKCLEQLRNIDVKACCVLDIDALYSHEISGSSVSFTSTELVKIKKLQQDLSIFLGINRPGSLKEDFKKQGIKFLSTNQTLKQQAEEVIEVLEKYGLFVLRRGTLEAWTGVKKNEYRKVQKMFNYLDRIKKPEIFSLIRKLVAY